MTTLGTRLKELREAKGWSQNELAQKAKIASSAISYFERDDRKPSADVLIRLSNALGVSVDYILGQARSDILNDMQLEIFHRNLEYLPKEKRDSRLRLFNTILKDDVPENEDDSDLR